MKKVTLSISSLLIVVMSYGQTQCKEMTKSNNQCKNVVKQGDLCYLHNPNYVKQVKSETLVCSGTNKSGNKCKNKTKNVSGLCHHHRKNN